MCGCFSLCAAGEPAWLVLQNLARKHSRVFHAGLILLHHTISVMTTLSKAFGSNGGPLHPMGSGRVGLASGQPTGHGSTDRSSPHMIHEVPGTLEKLGEVIKEIRVSMMYTWSSPGASGNGGGNSPGGGDQFIPGAASQVRDRGEVLALRARPMYTQRLDPKTYNGVLWFFADAQSNLVTELGQNGAVMLVYSSPEQNTFASITGRAHCEHDPAKAKELWNIHAKGWWPEGPGSENLTLIRVAIGSGEYWDGPSNTSYMLQLFKAGATGARVNISAEHGVV